MEIIPFRTYTDDSLAADFPAAKIIFHADDFTSGATTWAARKGDITANLAAAAVKDASGVYTTVTNSVSSVTGTMPTVSTYVVAVAIGNLQTNSASTGVSGIFGAQATGPALTCTGIATDSAAGALNSAPSLTGSITALNADPGRAACQAVYWDMVDTTSPLIARALASSLSTDQAIPNGTATTTDTGQIVLGAAINANLTITALSANNDGRRVKIFALFEFSTALTLGELQVAVAEMARTGELFAGWRNRT